MITDTDDIRKYSTNKKVIEMQLKAMMISRRCNKRKASLAFHRLLLFINHFVGSKRSYIPDVMRLAE